MIPALLFTVLFAISGILISEVVFTKHKVPNRIWLGLVIGLLMLTWLPSLFGFVIGFTLAAQILSAAAAAVLGGVAACILLVRRKRNVRNSYRFGKDWIILFLAIPILVLCCVLLHTHILYKHANGSLWVGQVTYGDLAMHLGFITSIAEQTAFPPQYSIFPGHAVNYPFLCETSGASLYLLGASVRQAYVVSAFYAFVLVVFSVYRFFEQWLKRRSRAVFATILFFFGSGFGFFYFLDLSKTGGGLLSSLLGTGGQPVSEVLLEGFYQTPTNLPALGLRWVNPIIDMLIPQRATLFGWAFLFPCLYLLHGFAFERKRENLIPLAVLAGLLPLIHTHSFLALGIVSAVYCITDLISVRFAKDRLIEWVAYAGIACLLAAPQLLLFTFRQTSESGLVRFHLNWANQADSYLWFYVKNLGMIFLLMPFAFLVLPKRDKKIYLGAVAIWLIAELIEFQPNDYDNNKLLFVWFAFTCGIVSKFIFVVSHRISRSIRRKYGIEDRQFAHRIAIAFLSSAVFLFVLFKIAFDSKNGIVLRHGTALTLLFVSGLLLALCIGAMKGSRFDRIQALRLTAPTLLSVVLMEMMLAVWLRQYRQANYSFDRLEAAILLILSLLSLILSVLARLSELSDGRSSGKFAGASVAMTVAFYLLIVSMTASSAMTIVRECKSEYQVYTADDVELSEKIREATDPDDVILANSYHWNLITPLTGRSIVTGTGTFLYYHGIDTSQRENDVAMMYEYPSENADLFTEYGVRYVLISNAERSNYDVDYAYFAQNGEVAAQNASGILYRLNP